MKMRIAAAGNATAPLCKAAAGDVGEHLTICKPQAQQEFSVNLSSRRSWLETAREHLATAKPQAQAVGKFSDCQGRDFYLALLVCQKVDNSIISVYNEL